MKTSTPAKKTNLRARFQALPKDYAGLCLRWLPRKLHDGFEVESAEELVRVMALYEPEFTADQRDYFDLLSDLLEERHQEVPAKWPTFEPEEMLQLLVAEHQLSGAGLARILGVERSLGAKILKGDRRLTLAHLRALARHFQWPPAAFLPDSTDLEKAVEAQKDSNMIRGVRAPQKASSLRR